MHYVDNIVFSPSRQYWINTTAPGTHTTTPIGKTKARTFLRDKSHVTDTQTHTHTLRKNNVPTIWRHHKFETYKLWTRNSHQRRIVAGWHDVSKIRHNSKTHHKLLVLRMIIFFFYIAKNHDFFWARISMQNYDSMLHSMWVTIVPIECSLMFTFRCPTIHLSEHLLLAPFSAGAVVMHTNAYVFFLSLIRLLCIVVIVIHGSTSVSCAGRCR